MKNFWDKNYFLCEGYKTKISKKKIIYYHVPKSGGTTISNLFLSLFEKPYRILGTQIKYDNAVSCYENFKKDFNKIKKNNYDFISGHIQCLDFFKDRTSITTIRDPIERAISHYNMLIERKLININTDIEECFLSGLIPRNPITQMFSCKNSYNEEVNFDNKKLAISNLKSVDLIISVEKIHSLINYLISTYNLPNILYQKLQMNKKNYFKKNETNINKIKKHNNFDIEIFNLLNSENIFFNFPSSNEKRFNNDYFIYSIDFKINGHNSLITQRPKYNAFVSFLEKNNFVINKV